MKLCSDKVTGLVLAGGRARRMAGRDKGLIELAGRPMVHWVVQRLVPQTASVLISANRNVERYTDLGFEVIRDVDDGFLGPLAGISAGLTQAATPWLVTVPCDSPLLVADLVVRLSAAVAGEGTGIAVAHDGNRLQPVFSLIHRDLAPDLVDFLEAGGRKIDLWLDRHVWARVDFSDHPDMFLNINTPEELAELEKRLQL